MSYLQAKQVWRPSAAYAGAAARTRDPDAMDISLVGDGKGKGKEKMARERTIRRAKGKRPKEKGKTATTTKVAKVNRKRIVAPYAGKPAIPLRSVGSTQKANQRGRARKELQVSLKTIRQWSLQGHLHLKLVVTSKYNHPSIHDHIQQREERWNDRGTPTSHGQGHQQRATPPCFTKGHFGHTRRWRNIYWQCHFGKGISCIQVGSNFCLSRPTWMARP